MDTYIDTYTFTHWHTISHTYIHTCILGGRPQQRTGGGVMQPWGAGNLLRPFFGGGMPSMEGITMDIVEVVLIVVVKGQNEI